MTIIYTENFRSDAVNLVRLCSWATDIFNLWPLRWTDLFDLHIGHERELSGSQSKLLSLEYYQILKLLLLLQKQVLEKSIKTLG